MAYVRQSPSKNGKDAIAYCRDGEFDKFWGKDGSESSKCLLIDQSNLLHDEVMSFEEQMALCWNHYGNANHLNEVRRLIFSFAPDEIDNCRDENGEFFDNEAPYKAVDIVKNYCEKNFPNRQICYFVQADGKRHKKGDQPKLHVHVIVNDWSLENGKGVPTEMTDDLWLAESFTEFAKDYYFETGEKFNLTKDHDTNMDTLRRNYKPNRYHEKRSKESWFEKQITDKEMSKLDEDGYYNSYKDYIVDIIKSAYDTITSEEDFETYLCENGIDVELKNSKKKGSYFKYTIRDEFIVGKGSNPKVKAPRTNNPSIGDDKLSKWTDIEIGIDAVKRVAEANKSKVSSDDKFKVWHAEWDNIVTTGTRNSAFDDMLKKLDEEKRPSKEPVPEQIQDLPPKKHRAPALSEKRKRDTVADVVEQEHIAVNEPTDVIRVDTDAIIEDLRIRGEELERKYREQKQEEHTFTP